MSVEQATPQQSETAKETDAGAGDEPRHRSVKILTPDYNRAVEIQHVEAADGRDIELQEAIGRAIECYPFVPKTVRERVTADRIRRRRAAQQQPAA